MFAWTKDLPVLFRSPLCRHIAFAVFLSIIAIEAVILVPSYWSQEARLLADLGEHARIVAISTVNDRNDRIERASAASIAKRMLLHPNIKGVVLVSSEGGRLAEAGERIRAIELDKSQTTTAQISSPNGPRYEVFWRAGTLFANFSVAVSLDRSPVVSNLQYFVLRIGGLITLIAAFVTLTTMLVLGRRLIFPMLRLRKRLIVGQDDAMEFEVPAANQTDEFGDIIRQFNGMLAELYQIKRGLEQRVAERTADLAQSEERLRAIIDNSPALIYLKDADSRILLINKAYEQRHGIVEAAARGSQGYEWLGQKNAEQLIEHDRKVIAEGRPVATEFVYTTSDGTTTVMQVVKFPVRDPARKIIGIGGIGTDITERKQAEEALQQAKLEAEAAALQAREASKAKSNFLAIMSHELRTPMNGVLGMADIISRTDLTAQQRDFLETLRESGHSLMELLNDILDLSKIEAGRVDLEKRDFSVGDLLESTKRLWTHAAEDKGLAFSIGNAVTDNDLLRGDRNRLRQVINNLLGNAIKFTAEGNVALQVSAHSLDEERAQLRFEIHDTGIGI
jgi:PAS domain S-box-containing protein